MTRPTHPSLSAVAICGLAFSMSAQTGLSTGRVPDGIDDLDVNTVTAYAIRYGKLALTSIANPRPTFLPTAEYESEPGVYEGIDGYPGVSVVVQDGLIEYLEGPEKKLMAYKYDRRPGGEPNCPGGAPYITLCRLWVQSIALGPDRSLRINAVNVPPTIGTGDVRVYLFPDGTFSSTDGKRSITIQRSRPVRFFVLGGL